MFAYLGNQRRYYLDCLTNETGFDSCYGIKQMAFSHKYLDLDKVFDEYATKYKYDYNKILNSETEWEMVVSNIETGKPEYKCERQDVNRLKAIGSASCSLPIITFPVELDGNLYLDGGICDSIPIKRAEEMGCEYNVVIETRRKDHFCHISDLEKPAYQRLYGKKYPNFLNAAFEREQMYRDEISYIDEQVKNGKVFLIRPTLPEVSRLEKDLGKISLSYYHGYTKAEEVYKDLLKFMEK